MTMENLTRDLLLASSLVGLGLAGCEGTGVPGSADHVDGQTSVSLSASETGASSSEGESWGDGTTTGNDPDGHGTDAADGSADTGSGEETTSTQGTGSTLGDEGGDSTGHPVGDGGSVPCEVSEATLEPVAPNIMLVLDKSGSMILNTWDHDDDPLTPEVTRWYSLYHVVEFVVNTFDAQINFGANLFPSMLVQPPYSSFEEACLVSEQPEVLVAPMNANAVLAGIPGALAEDIHGGTPATAGVVVAREHLLGLASENPSAIVFIADGAPNCMEGMTGLDVATTYDHHLPQVVGATWTNHGIPTYVVGIDIETTETSNPGDPQGIIPWEVMNEVAEAGGRPRPGLERFYQANNQVELEAALQAIIDDALGCLVPLSPEPVFPHLLELYVGGTMVPHVADCENEDGWVYTNPNGPYDEIELCGSWCAELVAAGSATAEYYCAPA
jgi:hypothetical protein